jgi:DNA-binding XRE family transcriptional regulator
VSEVWKPEELVAARCDMGLTQGELGAVLGMTRDGIASMETGRSPITRVTSIAMEHVKHCMALGTEAEQPVQKKKPGKPAPKEPQRLSKKRKK